MVDDSSGELSERLVGLPLGDVGVLYREGDLPTIVLLHGAGHNAAIWGPTAAHLTGREIVAIDLTAHGQTTTPSADLSPRAVAHDVSATLDVLSVEAAVVVGHSWGAHVALELANTPQVTGLILVESVPGSYDEVYEGTEWTAPEPNPTAAPAEPVTADQLAVLARGFEEDPVQAALLRRSHRLTEASASGYIHPTPEESDRRAAGAWAQPLGELYDRLTRPVLLIRAEEVLGTGSAPQAAASIRRHFDQLVKRHEEFQIAWLSCGHAVPYLMPPELASLIAEFVDGMASAR